MRVIYASEAAAFQGIAAIKNVILPPGLGPYTDTSIIVPPLVQSNICFPAGTEVATDQGIVAIEQIIPGKHTIYGETIDYITRTISNDPYLVKINKDALGKNKPTKTTIMSKDHKIEVDGQMLSAYRLLGWHEGVSKVKYSGEILYNVLMKEYRVMYVHNLKCETLEPSSPIACKYQGTIYNEKKSKQKIRLVKMN